MNKLILLSVIALTFSCNFYPEEEKKPATIDSFTIAPLSVNEGSPITISLSGSFDSCDLTANGEEIKAGFGLADAPTTDIPTVRKTEYKLICSNDEGVAEASVTVNLIVADDIVETDLIAEIGKLFNLDEIKALLEGVTRPLTDYTGEIDLSTLPLPDNAVLRLDTAPGSAFDLEKSVVYGFEDLIIAQNYTATCKAEVGNQNLVRDGQFEGQIAEGGNEKSLTGDSVHIEGFTAITQSIDEPIPAGTAWKVGFSLSETRVNYSEEYEDYSKVSGIFTIETEVSRTSSISSIASTPIGPVVAPPPAPANNIRPFPRGYPVPRPGLGYTYDPTHPVCDDPSPQYIKAQYNNADEYCAAVDCDPENLPRFPVIIPGNAETFDYYVGKQASIRVFRGNAKLNCKQLFGSVAKSLNINGTWEAQSFNNDVLFFNTSNSCQGGSCPAGLEARLTQTDPASWNQVEPGSNFCIDRWKGFPFAPYKDQLFKVCATAPVYTAAVAAAAANAAADKMAQNCDRNNRCKNLGISLNSILADSSLSIDQLQGHIDNIQREMDLAKKEGESYIIPSGDSYFNRLEAIDTAVNQLDTGYPDLIAAQASSGASFSLGLEKILRRVAPTDFKTPLEFRATIDEYLAVVEQMKELAKPEAPRISCSYSATGKFRVFTGIRVLEVRRESIADSEVSADLESIAPKASN